MLKLIKYELIGSWRQFALTFGIYILCCLATPFLPMVIREMVSALVMLAFTGILFSIFINVIIYFNRSMYKRPGYLSLTLPVTTHDLVISKLVGAVIWFTVTFIILFIGIFIILLSTTGVSMGQLFNGIGSIIHSIVTNADAILSFIKGGVYYLLSIASVIMSFYLTITFVNTKFVPKYKIATGIIVYIVGSLLVGYLLSIIINNSFIYSLTSTGLYFIECGITLIGLVICYFGTVYLIDHYIVVE